MIEDDWSDDISIPEIQCTEDIEMREYAKIQAESWMGKRICRELIMEMIRRAESVSSINQCMNRVMDSAWRRIKEMEVRKLLEGDKELVTFTSDLILSWRVLEIKKIETEMNEERMLMQAMLTLEWKARREMMMDIDPAEMTLSQHQNHCDDSALIE